MNILTSQSVAYSQAPWKAASHAPMYKRWQAMLYQPGAKSGREYFFYRPDYPTVKDIVERVELEARWCFAKRFSIRDEHGTEVFDGEAMQERRAGEGEG